MKRNHWVFLILLVVSFCFLATAIFVPAGAKEVKKKESNISIEAKAKPNPVAEDVANLSLAHSLIQYGRKTNSPEALITAAGILAKVKTSKIAAAPKQEKNQPEPSGKVAARTEGVAPQNTPAALLAEAKKMSSNSPPVVALADQVAMAIGQQVTLRGAVGGPKSAAIRLPAYTSDVYTAEFYGGEIAKVAVVGDGYTDLDLYVYDENGNLIVADTNYNDECLVTWVPRWTGKFLIKVRNRGSDYNDYVIMTN